MISAKRYAAHPETDFAGRCFENPQGYHGERAGTSPTISMIQRCEDCGGAGGDGDDPSVGYLGSRCATCDGTGIAQRSYLAEAFRIAAGESPQSPEPEHVKAVVEYCRKLASAALTLPEVA
jgi:hypothetical protein